MSKIQEQTIGSETYSFDTIRGIQAGREFYVAMCPLKIIPKLFIFFDYDLPPEMRAQRTLSKSRIPALKNYILNNPDDYIFSSLTASVDGTMKFIPASHLGEDSKLGRLYISMDSRLLINDGQHRRKAIEEALKEQPSLGREMISVVFFHDSKLKRSQQMFSDLNKNVVRPTKSLSILYDHRNKFSQFIVQLTSTIEIFKDRVECEKTTISNRSKKTFTLNGISDASMHLIGRPKAKRISQDEKEIIEDFWSEVSKNIPEWQLLMQNKITSSELRKTFVHGNTNLLHALGISGRYLIKNYNKNWKSKLRILQNIDWTRNNPDWDGRLMLNGQMVRHTLGIELAANMIIQKMGIELTNDRLKFEDK